MLLLASCDPAPPRGDPDVPSRRGGEITFGVLGEPATLDPYAPTATDLTYALARPVHRSLFRVLPDGAVTSDLGALDTMESVPGGVVVELERARWSNGRRITAQDVVRSVAAARYPSGFAALDAAAVDRSTVRFSGPPSKDWARRLAVGTFVLPRRGGLRVASGPFVMTRYVPGLQIVFEPNPAWVDEGPLLDRITVQFISSTQIILELLERGRLDAAAVPSAVNLDDRLDELGTAYEEALGWETIALDLDETADEMLRSRIIAAVDRAQIAEGLIRDEGTIADATAPTEPSREPDVEILLGTASGDELLQLMQRILQRHLARHGVKAELVQIDPATLYGRWESNSPLDVALRREIVPEFRKRRAPDDLRSFPLFSVNTFVAWNGGYKGLAANGTLDGPLWNAHEWWLE